MNFIYFIVGLLFLSIYLLYSIVYYIIYFIGTFLVHKGKEVIDIIKEIREGDI